MPHAERVNSKIFLQTAWNEADLVKLIPGSAWNNSAKMWTLPLTWVACLQARAVFGTTLTLGDDLIKWASLEKRMRVDKALDARNRTEPHVPWISNSRLRPFQRAGVDFLTFAGSALLGDDMGAGKTPQTLVWLRHRDTQTYDALPALVICPNSVKFNWKNELEEWFPGVKPYVIGGGAATRKKLLLEAKQDPRAFVIINFEGLRGHTRLSGYGSERLKRCGDCDPNPDVDDVKKCEVHPKELNLLPFKTVIVDEAHRIKDPHAKQTRAAWAVGHQTSVNHRLALTGTPGDPEELWSILHFLQPDEFPTKSKFIDRYCIQAWNAYGGLDVKGIHPQFRDEFYAVLDPRFRRMPKELVLPQLPSRIRSQRIVELTPKQRKSYTEIAEGLVTRLPDGNIMVAKNDLEAQIRLIQFSSATMEQTLDGFKMCDPSSKLDALVDIHDELNTRQYVVAAEHRQLIELAARRYDKMKISYGLITGKQLPVEREVALRDFQAGKLQALLFTHKAGGTGLTMTAADTLVCLQRSWSVFENHQTEGRVHRIGSERHESIQLIDVVARDTVEEKQVERLWEKSERIEEINRDRARLAEARLTAEAIDLDAELQKIMSSNLGDA